MQKLIACSISTLSYSLLLAQPAPATYSNITTQVNQLLSYARTDFKNMPVDYKPGGFVSGKVLESWDGGLFYHSIITQNLTASKAKAVLLQLALNLEQGLGDGYESNMKTGTELPEDFIFNNKCNCDLEVIRLKKVVTRGKYDIYMDVSFNRKQEFANKNPDSSAARMQEITSKAIKIIAGKLGVEEGIITAASSFTDDLGMNSLEAIEIVMLFEDRFKITIPDEDAFCICTVGQAVSYLAEHSWQ